MAKRWVPLESNPDVMNVYAKTIGAPHEAWRYCDVLGMDPELLAMVPRPVKAVLMLFPITDATEAARKAEEERVARDGQTVSDNVWYSRQTVSNACGTVAMLHAYANNGDLTPQEGSFLARFLAQATDMSPEERARFLERPKEGEPDIEEAHQAAAQTGQSAPPPEDEQVLLHYVCFVHVDGCLYELDGRKKTAINHGATTPHALLEDSCRVVKRYMEATGDIRFTMIALAAAD